MNRRHFLQTVGGAAAGALLPAGVEAEAAAARQAAPVPPPASRIAVLWQPGVPTVDADPVPEGTLHDALTGFTSSWLDADALAAQLARDRFDVVLTPYGSAIPRLAWPALRAFLAAGGNWVNLGGAPCSVPVSRDGSGWRAEMPQTTLARRARHHAGVSRRDSCGGHLDDPSGLPVGGRSCWEGARHSRVQLLRAAHGVEVLPGRGRIRWPAPCRPGTAPHRDARRR